MYWRSESSPCVAYPMRSIFFRLFGGSFWPGLGWDAILKQKSQTEIWNKRFFETNPDWLTEKVGFAVITYIMIKSFNYNI